MVQVSNPVDIKEALVKHELFDKALSSELGFETSFFGMSVALAPAHEWKRHRKVVNPAFRRKWPTELFGDLTRIMIEEIDTHPRFDPGEMMQRMTLDALSVAAFGDSMDALRKPNSEIVLLYNQVMKDVFNPIPVLFPAWMRPMIPVHRVIQSRVQRFNQWIFEMIDEKQRTMRKDDDDENRNLLELMIEASQNGEQFSREDLRANTVTFFVAVRCVFHC
jgi:cytochrome P450